MPISERRAFFNIMRGNRSSDERCYVNYQNTGNIEIPKDKLSFIPRIKTRSRMEAAPVANRRISKVIEVGREESFR